MLTSLDSKCGSCATAIQKAWSISAPICLDLVTAVLLLVGLIVTVRQDTSQPRQDPLNITRLVPLGPGFSADPFALFGMRHSAEPDVVSNAAPSRLPAHRFSVNSVGIASIEASLDIPTEKMARQASLLVGIMLSLFILLIYVPKVVRNTSKSCIFQMRRRTNELEEPGNPASQIPGGTFVRTTFQEATQI